jgi:hypothetical protein
MPDYDWCLITLASDYSTASLAKTKHLARTRSPHRVLAILGVGNTMETRGPEKRRGLGRDQSIEKAEVYIIARELGAQ